MITITVTNQKGGAGKTTTAAALAAGLYLTGKRTLLIDLDAQGNLSYSAGIDTSGATVLGVMLGEVSAADAIRHTPSGDFMPASEALSGADAFINGTGREYKLKRAIEPLKGSYDYCIIDTPPALGILTINALTACDSVIIPAQADIYSLQGIEKLAEAIRPIKEYCNHDLTIAGILLTRYSPRSVLSRDIAEQAELLAAKLGTKLFKTTIREAIAVREAQLNQQTLYEYAPSAKVTEDYKELVKEILKEQEK